MFSACRPFGLAILIVLMAWAAADAQYAIRPYPGPFRGPWYPPGPYGYSSYPYPDWQSDMYWDDGGAALVNAYANYQVQSQQADLIREKVAAEKIANQKSLADMIRYEQSQEPTEAEVKARRREQEIRDALGEPTTLDITSGRALNTLPPYLASLRKQGKGGTDVKLDPEVVAGLNVARPEGRTLGPILLATRADQWPQILRGPEQHTLVELLQKAVKQAVAKQLDVGLVNLIRKETETFQKDFGARYLADKMSVTDFYWGKAWFEGLQRSYDTLLAPEALSLLGVTAAAETVDELVQYMTVKGLRFAAALPNHEAAYIALHSAFVQYANGDVNASGFRLRIGVPIDKAAKKG
jgi:hypothetical protein